MIKIEDIININKKYKQLQFEFNASRLKLLDISKYLILLFFLWL